MSKLVSVEPAGDSDLVVKANTIRIVLSLLTLLLLLVIISFYLLLGINMLGQLEGLWLTEPHGFSIVFVLIMSAPLMGVNLVMAGIGVVIAWSVKERAPRTLAIAGGLLSFLGIGALYLGFALTYTSIGFTIQSASIMLGFASLVLLSGALGMILMRSMCHPLIAMWVRLLVLAVVVVALLVASWFVYSFLSWQLISEQYKPR